MDIDLSFFEALDQVLGGYVDQLDGVGSIEDRVRHGLPHADTGDLRHHVVQTFDVLDVERRIDVDPLAQQLFDVEIAFGVPAAATLVWASSSTSANSGLRAIRPSRSISSRW